MKAFMRSYVYWYGKDKDIGNLQKLCIVAKAPLVKFNLKPKTNKPWLNIDYASPIKGGLITSSWETVSQRGRSFEMKNNN